MMPRRNTALPARIISLILEFTLSFMKTKEGDSRPPRETGRRPGWRFKVLPSFRVPSNRPGLGSSFSS